MSKIENPQRKAAKTQNPSPKQNSPKQEDKMLSLSQHPADNARQTLSRRKVFSWIMCVSGWVRVEDAPQAYTQYTHTHADKIRFITLIY